MEILRTRSFETDFAAIPQTIRRRFIAKLGLFLHNPFHPSLRCRKMQGTPDVWEFRISQSYRCTFSIRDRTYNC